MNAGLTYRRLQKKHRNIACAYCRLIAFFLLSSFISLMTQAQEVTDTFKVKELETIHITSRSATQQAAEQSIKASVVDTRQAYQQPATLTELINRTPGMRIRQSGGLGSGTDISINGFQGKAIRYMKDGIPVDYLREGFTIASIPVNSLERVEIYKGVLPVALGADALGGAVNLVSRRAQPRYLAASYEIASFNTHRATLSGFYTDSAKRWFLGMNGFYNYSDNDYKAKVKVTDPNTSNQVYDRVRLFHNRFTNVYGEMNAGFTNRRWADELAFTVSVFDLKRQQNHPALMTDPYGAVTGRQSSVAPTLRYKKSFLQKRLFIDQFLAHNTVRVQRTDTLAGRYDWYGAFYSIPGRVGESRQPALSDIDYTNTTSRTYVKYLLNRRHALEFNNVFTEVRQKGTDPYGPKLHNTDTSVISLPAIYKKIAAGIGLVSHFWDDKLETAIMGKFYHYRSSGTEAWQARPILKTDAVTQTGNNQGAAIAAKYNFTTQSFLRLSAELANRLPDQEELFGDGIWTVPNFNLSPERSLNINLGYRVVNTRKDALEINGFYRRTRDLILLVPVQPPYAQYHNIQNVKGFGLEADGVYHLNSIIAVNANFTWQDIRLFKLSSSTDGWQNNARLRNTPYFFANAGIVADIGRVAFKEDRLKLYSHYSFVREYYLETIPKRLEPGGFLGLFGSSSVNTELIIPNQHFWTAGFNYAPSGNRFSVGVEVKNILNQDLYDNYRVQKAGRSFHCKINYTIQ